MAHIILDKDKSITPGNVLFTIRYEGDNFDLDNQTFDALKLVDIFAAYVRKAADLKPLVKFLPVEALPKHRVRSYKAAATHALTLGEHSKRAN